jgi:hypothetical protein
VVLHLELHVGHTVPLEGQRLHRAVGLPSHTIAQQLN